MRRAINAAFDGFEEALAWVRRKERANYQLETLAQVLLTASVVNEDLVPGLLLQSSHL